LADIVERRAQMVAEIARLRDAAASSKFIDKAQILLTRYWSSANLASREELLKAADWLIRLERGAANSMQQSW
jgi:hypothetical protein